MDFSATKITHEYLNLWRQKLQSQQIQIFLNKLQSISLNKFRKLRKKQHSGVMKCKTCSNLGLLLLIPCHGGVHHVLLTNTKQQYCLILVITILDYNAH